MSKFSHPLPGAAGVLAWARKVVYGPGYRRARREAFRRSGGICQLCGLRPAEETHHWPWRYPSDEKIAADHLTALCRPCHWAATLRRLFARTQARVWFILADTAVTRAGARADGFSRDAASRRPKRCHSRDGR